MLDFNDVKIDIEDEKTRELILNFFSIFVYLSNFYDRDCIIHTHCKGVQIEGKVTFVTITEFPKIYSKGADKLRALAYISIFRNEKPVVENDLQAISSISIVPLYFSIKMKDLGITKFISSLSKYYIQIYKQIKKEDIKNDFREVLNSFSNIDTKFLDSTKNYCKTVHLCVYSRLLSFTSGEVLSSDELLRKYGIIEGF
ncbi:hypothetical protein [Acidianus sp. HS-5]|uniref:hypothetical protein n=1 Tax=Acidianus sp. HS-5 TaxID=2886040 RepID=UPI001F411195|nr:hypothetical protein [Acidianus sp. HS-5]BDC17979.1 hypothetical protein HS5_08690 [Acidianus sp. HS-5]